VYEVRMPIRTEYPEGVPAWVDLSSPDVGKSEDFYGALFDWEFREEPGDSPYLTALGRGLPAAGIGPVQGAGQPAAWTTYFAVDDADLTATRIAEAGGQVLFGPDDVGVSGRLAVALDPTGASFGIWQAGDHIGAEIVNEHGGLNWNELLTDDIDAATRFYVTVFGFEDEVEDWGDGRSYTTYKVGGRGIAGGAAKPNPDIPNHWSAYFAVSDAHAAVEIALANDGAVLREALDAEGVGIIARLADPFGAPFNIIELANEID
jgi:predicted enzyme related to lactoylglutathione lyase